MATTQVILTAKIPNLGAEADIVKVRAGYARNYLFPRGFALEKTKGAERRLNALKAKRAEREATELNEGQEVARRINKMKLAFELETGETGKAFGSITATDIAKRLTAELGGGIEIDHHKVQLDRPIKESGEREIPIKIHSDVTATLRIVVKAHGASEEATPAPAEEEKGFKAKPKAKHAK
ncbi:MAG: 50S ribosomal protein L9 [Chthoniobacteraceae bacterium]